MMITIQEYLWEQMDTVEFINNNEIQDDLKNDLQTELDAIFSYNAGQF